MVEFIGDHYHLKVFPVCYVCLVVVVISANPFSVLATTSILSIWQLRNLIFPPGGGGDQSRAESDCGHYKFKLMLLPPPLLLLFSVHTQKINKSIHPYVCVRTYTVYVYRYLSFSLVFSRDRKVLLKAHLILSWCDF